MDSLFDDKPYEVGDEIEAYCPNPRCRGDTGHVIKSMYENEIRRVECSVCNDTHAYRKPRGVPFDEEPTPEPALKKKGRGKKKPTWEEAMAKVTEQELANCRPYSIYDNYELLDVVSHPIFELGFVTELLPDNKVEVTFKDSGRILVHRKKGEKQSTDFASGISQLPAPRKTRSRRKRRKKGPSELAQRLMSERMLAQAGTKNFEQVAEAKEELAERAARQNRRLALEMVVKKMEKGLELTETEKRAASEAKKWQREEEQRRKAEELEKKRLEREKEREKKRLEREKEREKKRLEREKEKARQAKERERERIRRERERERERKRKEREKEKARKAKEREKLRKEKQREKARKAKEREKLRREKERERARKRKAAEAARKKREAERKATAGTRAGKGGAGGSLRRTGGKKTIASTRRTGGKKTIASIRRKGGGKKSVR
ncbi:MAG: hypothetical protein KJO07_18175 [Deltaproteobacteria bacterium]|nr:hypothetical protein [Deltaproteobacteria bacterium]